jgi:hypothetical protein
MSVTTRGSIAFAMVLALDPISPQHSGQAAAAFRQSLAAASQVPTHLASNLAWWSADDGGTNATLVSVSVPAALTSWTDPMNAFTVTGGHADPFGGTNTFRMMEKTGSGYRWLAHTPAGYVSGPCKLEFYYKPIDGASVWEADGSTFAPQFEFTSNGVGQVGVHPYSSYDNTWFSVAPAAGGFYKVNLWLQGAIHIRTTVTLSTVGNRTPPPTGDASKGLDLYGMRFSQHYVTGLRDLSPNGAHLTGVASNAPFFQRSNERFGLLTGGSCLWQPDETRKYLTTSNAALCAALSGAAPCTVLALVRRQWCRYETGASSAFFQAVAASGNDYTIGFTAGGGAGAGNRLYVGGGGATGPVAAAMSDFEWNVVGVVNTGNSAAIYLLDGASATLLAGPTNVSRGTIASVRLCVERCAVREVAVWGAALDLGVAQAQAGGMIARAGGWQKLNVFETFDGVRIETRTKTAPYHWRDDSGVAFYGGACWLVAGAVETILNSSDVWRSTDYGATWSEVTQTIPFAASEGAAAFTLASSGKTYLYYVACYERFGGIQSIYRSTDGSTWTNLCANPPWSNHFGQAVGILGTNVYVMGGQSKGRDPASAVNSVHKSSDGGKTWTQLADAPWQPRMAFGPLLPAWKNKLWVVHGGTYSGASGLPTVKYNDVWAFDGATWTPVLAHTPWSGTLWSTSFVLDNELFVMSGWADDGDHRMLWRTADGVNWRSSFPLPWGQAHESSPNATDRGVLLAPTDWNQTTRLLTGTNPVTSGLLLGVR